MSDADLDLEGYESRARAWVQNFLEDDRETMVELGETYEYLLDNVDAWENGTLDTEDFPHFDTSLNHFIRVCVLFGTLWPPANRDVYAVSEEDGSFVGLYGHEDHADERVAAEDGWTKTTFHPKGASADEFPARIAKNDRPRAEDFAANFEAMLEMADDFQAGDWSPDDLPRLDQNIKWIMGYSVMMGTLWELSHPALYGVFAEEQQLQGVYAMKSRANEVAEVDGEWVQRLSVVDGDLPPERVIGPFSTQALDALDDIRDVLDDTSL